MCGRFAYFTPPHVWAEIFAVIEGRNDWEALGPRYNVAPTVPVPCVRWDGTLKAPIAFAPQWGLIPSWSKDAKFASNCINARCESIDTKNSFRTAFKQRRCLVICDGFYEWNQLAPVVKGVPKQPHFFSRTDGKPLAIAGLWETWKPSPIQPEVVTCSIITTDANAIMAPLHDRLPVILPDAETLGAWLDPDAAPKALKSLLVPCDSELLQQWPVSTKVNSVKNQGAQLIAPITLSPQQETMRLARSLFDDLDQDRP